MNRRLTFILGGARSGKSSYAEKLAAEGRGDVLYVATAQAWDEEMRCALPSRQACALAHRSSTKWARRLRLSRPRSARCHRLSTLLATNVCRSRTHRRCRRHRRNRREACWQPIKVNLPLIIVSNEEDACSSAKAVYREQAASTPAATADQCFMVAGLPMVEVEPNHLISCPD